MINQKSIPGYFCDGLTKITIIRNMDGIHAKEETIGYVSEPDFCILSNLINKYYISKYNDFEIFPVNFFRGEYTLGIYGIGSRYNLDNFTKSFYPDMSRFIFEHTIMEKAEIDEDDEDKIKEYLTFLGNSSDIIPIINEAIQYNSIIKSIEDMEYDNIESYMANILSKLLSVDADNERNWFWPLYSYIIKEKCWELNSN